MTDNRKPGTVPVYREDILELTRRMNLERSNFTRIAGCYVDADGDFDGSFNTSFLKLPARDKSKHLEIAKAVLLSKTNDEYLRYSFATGKRPGDGSFADVLFSPESGQRELQQLLYGLTDCGLKNDALLDVLYDLIMEKYRPGEPYAVIVLYGIYDIPRKSSAGDYQDESEEVYEYIVCAVCPLKGEYEPGAPKCGFLYPALSNRSRDDRFIDIFTA